jgi:hypothetical protein
MGPAGQLAGSFVRAGMAGGVGPFAKLRLEEALGGAVGAWRIRTTGHPRLWRQRRMIPGPSYRPLRAQPGTVDACGMRPHSAAWPRPRRRPGCSGALSPRDMRSSTVSAHSAIIRQSCVSRPEAQGTGGGRPGGRAEAAAIRTWRANCPPPHRQSSGSTHRQTRSAPNVCETKTGQHRSRGAKPGINPGFGNSTHSTRTISQPIQPIYLFTRQVPAHKPPDNRFFT